VFLAACNWHWDNLLLGWLCFTFALISAGDLDVSFESPFKKSKD
jgi:hypothetical protein